MPTRYKITIRYDGHEFHGWQKQEPPDAEPLRTVQAVVETAIRRAVREPIMLLGASRTDSGVHAIGQVGAFTVDSMKIPFDRIHLAINRWLPEDVAIVNVENVYLDFNPISDTLSKGYRYTIYPHPIKPVFERHQVHHCWSALNADQMNVAAQHLIGEYDFASFANTHHGRESTIRTIHNCRVWQDQDQPRVHIDVSGSGFLYHMVRIIAGTLLEIGRGRWQPSHICEILNACNRRAAGPTLPPDGLCLLWIKYPTTTQSLCE